MGPYFVRDDQARHVTVNGNRYRSMITEYFWPQWNNMDLEDMSNRTAPQATQRMSQSIYWKPSLGNVLSPKWTSRLAAYANKPATIDELRTNIEREIA